MRPNIHGLPKQIQIDGGTYDLVQPRRNATGVYRRVDGRAFARYGARASIERELALHRELANVGFPVADILGAETTTDPAYVVEASLGSALFSELFRANADAVGAPSAGVFEQFLDVLSKFFATQAGTRTDRKDWDRVFIGAGLNDLVTELPDERARIESAWQKSQHTLAHLPFVLTHGDFTSHNTLIGGVIDFENHFYAPEGYDAISALISPTWFPRAASFGGYQRYFTFSRGQYDQIAQVVRTAAGYDPLALFAPFLFLRGSWHSVRMGSMPDLQQWRFERLKQLLDLYLSDALTPERWWQLDAGE